VVVGTIRPFRLVLSCPCSQRIIEVSQMVTWKIGLCGPDVWSICSWIWIVGMYPIFLIRLSCLSFSVY
jgi:hypothetical protein